MNFEKVGLWAHLAVSVCVPHLTFESVDQFSW